VPDFKRLNSRLDFENRIAQRRQSIFSVGLRNRSISMMPCVVEREELHGFVASFGSERAAIRATTPLAGAEWTKARKCFARAVALAMNG
jgi:hypothetical protein